MSRSGIAATAHHNASAAEEVTAASMTLSKEAAELDRMLSRFTLTSASVVSIERPQVSSSQRPRSTGTLQTSGSTTAIRQDAPRRRVGNVVLSNIENEDWAEF
jgi:hypothetical protein